jgi:phosphatidylserine/phosphatidylglycerophosphate/cardiolipin synthase-like enzyme
MKKTVLTLATCAGVAASLALSSFSEAKKKRESLLDKLGNRVDQAMVKPPQNLEVCFSPVEPCDTKLVKFIDTATASIDVAVFDITLDQVAHHLLVASKKIPVRVVADRRQGKGQHSLVKTLVKGGVPVRFGRQRGVMHNKFTLIDGKAVETGSFNYTNNASENNNENQIYLFDPQVVERYKKRFEEIWAEADPVEESDFAPQKSKPKSKSKSRSR